MSALLLLLHVPVRWRPDYRFGLDVECTNSSGPCAHTYPHCYAKVRTHPRHACIYTPPALSKHTPKWQTPTLSACLPLSLSLSFSRALLLLLLLVMYSTGRDWLPVSRLRCNAACTLITRAQAMGMIVSQAIRLSCISCYPRAVQGYNGTRPYNYRTSDLSDQTHN